MKLITGKIGSGKTFEMIRYACKHNLTIVFSRKELANDANTLAYVHFHHNLKTISYSDFSSERRIGVESEKYIIDDIESYLLYLNKDIQGFVYNGEDVTFTEKVNGTFYKRDLLFY